MDKCPRCGADAVFAGYEDARTFYQCEKCKRVWTTMVAAPVAGSRTPVRVLVADDSDLLVGLIASWLEDEGLRGRHRDHGPAGARCRRRPSSGCRPPRFDHAADGWLRSVRQAGGLPHPPEIVLMTGVSDPSHLNRAMDLCAATLLRKPLEAETVVAAVASAARRRQQPRRGVTHSQPVSVSAVAGRGRARGAPSRRRGSRRRTLEALPRP